MANVRTYRVDPNVFLTTAEAGTAQSPADRQAGAWAKILAAVNQQPGGYEVLDTTATSLDLTVYESQLNVSGTMAFTLGDGTFKGQRKRVRCVGAASTPAATLTVTTPETATGFACASTFFFDTVGQELDFVWTENSKWRCDRKKRAGGTADNVVVGTTELAGKSMWQVYALSIDGTKSSTTTKGLPNGSVIGERCQIINTTATNTPIGSIDGTFKGGLAAAYTHLGAIGVVASATVTGDMALLEWDGSSWTVLYQTGCTLS
jgi:hypothetical protein